MDITLLSINDTLDIAFDIFGEMADDNLEHQDRVVYQSHFDEDGAAIAIEPSTDWEKHVNFNVDRHIYIEVHIGLASNDVIDNRFARLLLSRDPEHKFCHILWKRDNERTVY